MPIKHVRALNERDVEVTVICRTCDDTTHRIEVRGADLRRYYERRDLIRDVFPYVAPPVRELMITGTCPRCRKTFFGADG